MSTMQIQICIWVTEHLDIPQNKDPVVHIIFIKKN